MEYTAKTNKTTPYWNCPTLVLEKKVQDITEQIEKINTIPGNILNYYDATTITNILIETRRCIRNQIEERKKKVQK